MRDPRKKLAKHSRRQRRAILAVILMAGSSAVMADGPQHRTLGNLPPLPLKSITNTHRIQGNPFCETTCTDQTVRLASGGKATSIRLKPIGAAIGLQSIECSEPKKVKRPAMIIEPVSPAVVRSNPLVESVHHTNHELVDTKVDDNPSPSSKTVITPAKPTQPPTPPGGGSIIILVPPAPVQPLASNPAPVQTATTAPIIEAEPIEAEPIEAEPIEAEPIEAEPIEAERSVTIEPYAPGKPTETSEVAAPAQSELSEDAKQDSEAVFFSLSDRGEPSGTPDSSQRDQADEVNAADEVDQPNKVDGTDDAESIAMQAAAASEAIDELDGHSDEADSLALGSLVRISDGASVELDFVEPIVLDDPQAESLEPMDSVIDEDSGAPLAIYRSQPSVVGPVEMPEQTLHTKRYRPPVAVNSVPLAFERSPETSPSIDRPTVQRVQEMNLSGLGLAATGSVKLTPLYMSRAQVRSLTVGGEVRGVKVADQSVCQAFASGPNQLKLIGTRNGVTQLVVWATADDADAPIRMRAFEIHVKDALEAKGDDVGDKAALLNQSIRKAFPSCSVSVRPHRDQLVVTGRCDSETSAKKIIRMVRKTCLVSVQDKLVVR